MEGLHRSALGGEARGMRIVVVLLAATLSISLWPGAEAQAQAARTFREPGAGFRFTYPSDWPTVEGRIPELRAVINTPGTANPGACTVAVHAAPEFEGLVQAQLDWSINNHPWNKEDWAASLGDRFTDITVRDQSIVKMANRPVHLATVVATDPAKPGTRTVQMVFLSRMPGQVWHMACGATGADDRTADAAFAARRIDFLRILSTFAWE